MAQIGIFKIALADSRISKGVSGAFGFVGEAKNAPKAT